MSKAEYYRKTLRTLTNWEGFLLKESGLPGPRANLELVTVVADEGTETQFRHFLTFDERRAPRNSQLEFLAVCGAVGMGQLLTQGNSDALQILLEAASDSRWRVREGVAMGLQRLGDTDMERLLSEMRRWSRGNFLEMRAAAAADRTSERNAPHSGLYHYIDFRCKKSRHGRLQSLEKEHGLLLECGGCRISRCGDAHDGTVVVD
jgi:hypothetical protein